MPRFARSIRAAGSLFLVSGLLVLAGCGSKTDVPEQDLDLMELVAFMNGSFSSEEQAEADPEFHDIRLEMVSIWPERDDGDWLYVEQAMAKALEKPYRQRVYRVMRSESGEFVSEVYAFEDPKPYIGGWMEPLQAFAGVAPDALVLREGCTVYLKRESVDAYVGGTRGEGCSSTLGDAVYATSEVTLGRDGITSWDRGFDAEGKQAWGAVKGGYVFQRQARGSREE